MTLGPELLLTLAADRVRAARPELAAGLDLSSPQAIQAVRAQLADAGPAGRTGGALAVSVIGRFHLADWVRETCLFALTAQRKHMTEWRRSFTRTVFLAGRPANLVVFDPTEEWRVEPPFVSKARNSAFTGERLRGRVRFTMLRGALTVADGKPTR